MARLPAGCKLTVRMPRFCIISFGCWLTPLGTYWRVWLILVCLIVLWAKGIIRLVLSFWDNFGCVCALRTSKKIGLVINRSSSYCESLLQSKWLCSSQLNSIRVVGAWKATLQKNVDKRRTSLQTSYVSATSTHTWNWWNVQISWSACQDGETSADTSHEGVAVGAMSHASVVHLIMYYPWFDTAYRHSFPPLVSRHSNQILSSALTWILEAQPNQSYKQLLHSVRLVVVNLVN